MSGLTPSTEHRGKKFVAFSDWDGTITTVDSNDYLTDNIGYGKERRRARNLDTLAGRMTFRDSFREMLESVSDNGHSIEDCKRKVANEIILDEGIQSFYDWCKANDIPLIILSSGMIPIIHAVLSKQIGEDVAREINIVANDVQVESGGKWHIKFRHPESGYGHDKSVAILQYKEIPDPPIVVFFGDGVSDLSAAKHADILFVKQKLDGENDLAAYCTREGIKHISFENFFQAKNILQSLVSGDKTIEDVLAAGKAS